MEILENRNVFVLTGLRIPDRLLCTLVAIPTALLLLLAAAKYEGHLESKERFAIQRYLLIIGKKKNMQVL